MLSASAVGSTLPDVSLEKGEVQEREKRDAMAAASESEALEMGYSLDMIVRCKKNERGSWMSDA